MSVLPAGSYRFSLHRAKTPKECEVCEQEIPEREPPDYAEFWRVKGGSLGLSVPRIICCLCHALYDMPTDDWEHAPDGRETLAALTPSQR